MKFRDVKFRGKSKFKANVIQEIFNILDHNHGLSEFSELSVKRYLEILVEEQDFNPKTHLFYDKFTNRKLNFNFLAGVAWDYIFENKREFKVTD